MTGENAKQDRSDRRYGEATFQKRKKRPSDWIAFLLFEYDENIVICSVLTF
jgi:hypothetical protein